ncbi:SET (Trithorax/polycomb) domain containing [Trichostrongylus colubriformis]|uniref:SET (Trithorax/polycomb) domain containing n=1 Tax=Trichostrongylus colubriformis TaxID=6319 RepID=A0AAN8FY53_TRICO
MEEEDPLQHFLSWCRTKGIVLDGLEIRSCEKSGNGVFATRSFRTDEKVIEVPEELMITAGKVADMDNYSKLLRQTKFLPTPFELLTLFFCMEDEELSPYAPYLKMLPKAFTTPSYIGQTVNPADLPLSVRQYWCTQQKDLQEAWERIKEVSPSTTHEKFLWAWHVVNTRCIYVENKPHASVDNSAGDTLAVVPFVDMLNHDPSAQCLATFERFSKKYVVRVSHCILEDQEVTVCYGPHDNARLWMEYGFTLHCNPNGRVPMEHALFIALARKVGVTVTSAHEQALEDAGLPCTLYLSDAGPNWAFRVNLKILMLSPSDIKRWREVIYSEKPRTESSNSSDDEESVIDEQEGAEYQILERIIAELKQALIMKLDKIPQELKWIWKEQITIVDVVLSSFTK